MSLILEELKEKLKRIEETILLEILEINSEDIVERYTDLIEDNFEQLEEDLQDETTKEL